MCSASQHRAWGESEGVETLVLQCQTGLFKALSDAVAWISEPHWCWQHFFFLPVTDEELGLSQVGSAGSGSLARGVQGFARDLMPWSQAGFRC